MEGEGGPGRSRCLLPGASCTRTKAQCLTRMHLIPPNASHTVTEPKNSSRDEIFQSPVARVRETQSSCRVPTGEGLEGLKVLNLKEVKESKQPSQHPAGLTYDFILNDLECKINPLGVCFFNNYLISRICVYFKGITTFWPVTLHKNEDIQ